MKTEFTRTKRTLFAFLSISLLAGGIRLLAPDTYENAKTLVSSNLQKLSRHYFPQKEELSIIPESQVAESSSDQAEELENSNSLTAGTLSENANKDSSNAQLSIAAAQQATLSQGVPSGQLSSSSVKQKQPGHKAHPAQSAYQAQQSRQVSAECYETTFYHKPMRSHSDGEACLEHSNVLNLNAGLPKSHSQINPNSVCVRVNGEAVKHRFFSRQNNVMIGPEAGPNAKVTARFCTGRQVCSNPCATQEDSFLSAIGASDLPIDQNWDGSKRKTNAEAQLEREIQTTSFLKGQTQGRNVFRGWNPKSPVRIQCTKGGGHETRGIKVSRN